MFPRRSVVLLLLTAVAILVLGTAAGSSGTALAEGPGGQVAVFVLMDNSGSMVESDPVGLRWQAARYFIDFLSADGQASGNRHEAGLILFSGSPVLELGLTDVAGANTKVKDAISGAEQDRPAEGATNFAAAFDQAAEAMRQRRSQGRTPSRYAFVVFTDGKADPRGDQYVRMKNGLARLREDIGRPVDGYVIAVGEGQGDARDWMGLLETEDSGQRYFPIRRIDDCFESFGEIGASLLGLSVGETVSIDRTGGFNVLPYLECLVLTVFKESGAEVEVRSPGSGQESEALDPVVSTDGYDIFFVSKPEDGVWSVTTIGAPKVWLLSTWLPASLEPRLPRSLHSTRRPLELELELVYPRSLTPVAVDEDYPLDLMVTASNPVTEDFSIRLAPERDQKGREIGRFHAVLLTRPLPGIWTIDLKTVNPMAAQAIPAATTTVQVCDLPVLAGVKASSTLWEQGGRLTVEAGVDGMLEFLVDPEITAELVDGKGRLLSRATFESVEQGAGVGAGFYRAVIDVPSQFERQGASGGGAEGTPVGLVDRARELAALVAPGRGSATLNVVMSGFCTPPGATTQHYYQDSTAIEGRLSAPLWWWLVLLALLAAIQVFALWPFPPSVGYLTWTDPAIGGISERYRFKRARLSRSAVVVAGPWMPTRFNWRDVAVKAFVKVNGRITDALLPGEECVDVPADQGSFTVTNASDSAEYVPPLGLGGHILAGVVLVVTVAVAWSLVIPGLWTLPGAWPKVIAALYALDSLACVGLPAWGAFRQSMLRTSHNDSWGGELSGWGGR